MSKTICPWARMERAQARVDGILERAWRRSPEAKRIDRLPPAALMTAVLRLPVPYETHACSRSSSGSTVFLESE